MSKCFIGGFPTVFNFESTLVQFAFCWWRWWCWWWPWSSSSSNHHLHHDHATMVTSFPAKASSLRFHSTLSRIWYNAKLYHFRNRLVFTLPCLPGLPLTRFPSSCSPDVDSSDPSFVFDSDDGSRPPPNATHYRLRRIHICLIQTLFRLSLAYI